MNDVRTELRERIERIVLERGGWLAVASSMQIGVGALKRGVMSSTARAEDLRPLLASLERGEKP